MNSNQSTRTAPAKRLFRILAVCIPVLMLLSVAQGVAQEVAQGQHEEPSDEAKGMPGALGTIPYRPDDWKGPGVTTYWRDTDGVDPGVAGCHIGLQPNSIRPNGRHFGEACQTPQILIESNPGADIIHSHTDDTGHPDRFDCAKWCVGARKATGGFCSVVPGPSPCTSSAVCVCN
jgi:hypothetical protein